MQPEWVASIVTVQILLQALANSHNSVATLSSWDLRREDRRMASGIRGRRSRCWLPEWEGAVFMATQAEGQRRHWVVLIGKVMDEEYIGSVHSLRRVQAAKAQLANCGGYPHPNSTCTQLRSMRLLPTREVSLSLLNGPSTM